MSEVRKRKSPLNRNSKDRRQIKLTLGEAQNWRCCYCGIRMDGVGNDYNAPTFEHVIPFAAGGVHAQDNLVLCCRECNLAKGRKFNTKMRRRT